VEILKLRRLPKGYPILRYYLAVRNEAGNHSAVKTNLRDLIIGDFTELNEEQQEK